MAFPNEILVGRFNKALNAVFGIKGQTPSATIGNEILPVYTLESETSLKWQFGWSRWAAAVDKAAVVGNISFSQISNPVGSGVIAVIEKIAVNTPNAPAGTNIQILMNNAVTGGGTAIVPGPLDFRQGPLATANSALKLFRNSNAAAPAGAVIWSWNNITGNLFQDIQFTTNQEITLTPGTVMTALASTGNQEFLTIWWWRERVMEDSELR